MITVYSRVLYKIHFVKFLSFIVLFLLLSGVLNILDWL